MPENYITCQDEKGSINISEDVVAAMVRAAITEVDGVAGIATSAGTELAGRHDHHGALWLQRCGRCQSGAGVRHERGGVHDRYRQAHCQRARVRRGV